MFNWFKKRTEDTEQKLVDTILDDSCGYPKYRVAVKTYEGKEYFYVQAKYGSSVDWTPGVECKDEQDAINYMEKNRERTKRDNLVVSRYIYK